MELFLTKCCTSKIKVIISNWPITKSTDNLVNQSKLEANKLEARNAGKHLSESRLANFRSTSDWLTNGDIPHQHERQC